MKDPTLLQQRTLNENGVTMTCQKFTHGPTSESPNLDIKNVQIVNGQQTVRSIYQTSKEGKLKPDVKILVRIVETTDRNLLNQIIEATNSQTKVSSRDLHSNDEVQKLIEQHFASNGYFYEARKNKYRGKEVSKRVDAEVATQAYYAIFFEQPALAKDKKKLLFGEKYDEIFNEKTDPQDILYSFNLLRFVQKQNSIKENREKYTFLSDATLHIIALMHRLDNKLDLSNENISKIYYTVLNAISLLVKERSKLEGDKYEHRRTFKDPETFGRAVEILQTN